MKVIVNGEAYECASARKTKDAVYLYDENGMEFAAFKGIKDISTYTVEGGEWTEEEAEPTSDELMDILLGVSE